MNVLTPYTKGAGYFMDGQKLNVSQRKEADVRTCTHCQAIIKMQEWKDQGAWCSKCFAPICNQCGAEAEIYGCVPFLKKIEDHAEKMMRFERFTKESGLTPEPQPLILSGR